MPPCHPFRPVPGQCGPNRRGPLPAPPFDPRDYWATKKFVSSLFGSLETRFDNLDEFYKVDVVDPGAATEVGQAADAKKTQEKLNGILAKLAKKADKATTLAGYGITDAATKTEIAAKADLVGGKVPAAQLPSYVDDVLEYDTMSAFPATGESGKIYVAKDTNLTYRWSGTQYVEISPLPVLDDTVTETSSNGVKSSGIWSWVKSLLPNWLTSDYAEPATVESVATKADKTALDDKRDKTDNVCHKTGFTEWEFSGSDYDPTATYEMEFVVLVSERTWYLWKNGSVYAMADSANEDDTFIDTFRTVTGVPQQVGITATRSPICASNDTFVTWTPMTNAVANLIKPALDDKRDEDDLAVYEKVGVGEWMFSVTPSLRDGERIEAYFQDYKWVIQPFDADGNNIGSTRVNGKETDFEITSTTLTLIRADGPEDVSVSATRAYKLDPVSPADSIAKVSQLPTEAEKAAWNGKLDKTASGEGYLGSISWKDEHTLRTEQAGIEINGGNLDVHGFIKADLWSDFSASSDTGGNLPAYLDSLAWRTTGNRTLSDYGITDGATKASLAPEYSETSAYSVGSIVWYDGNIYQCKTAIAEGGEAWNAEHWELRKLDGFFTESNSLLNGRLAYSRNATGLKDRAFNTLSFDGTEFNLSTALEAVTPTASGQPRDLLIVATATAATTISFTAGTIKGDKPTIDGAGTWLITLTEYEANTWYCRQIKMEDAA